ncbi:MAG: tRNA uridine-5-carboxymethylaminomethyl(34) synthesis GTPase MnmE [Bacteroidia bacterium]|nr:tRNA uridine-5-carboxymethylaminomethyl(34) synthesis GTPase MnmE [Bacteroidia bacterium]
MQTDLSDTIIALSTPPGIGAIGIIRLSGPKAIKLVDQVFFGRNLTKVEGNTVHYGKIKDENDRILDECMATVFRTPKSYTREDVVELSCHGSPYILNQVIQLLIRMGIRQAEPGEFTLRAFLNGQLDLSQAEAVADLIASDSSASHDLAMKQMRGGFSNEIQRLRQELIDFASLIELELDFAEEDVQFADRTKLKALVEKIQGVIRQLLSSFQLGNVLKQGVSTVIAGKPNAGKSTLLNAMLQEERAIVSDIAGTTRDTIEATLNIEGIQFRLIDTAGIRDARDKIEAFGVERTMEAIQASTIVLYVIDVIETSQQKLIEELKAFNIQNSKFIIVLNKMDLNPYTKPEDYYSEDWITSDNVITTSALNKMNIDYLKEQLFNLVISDKSLMDHTIVSNSRHYEALTRAAESLDAVDSGLKTGISSDFVAMDIRQALHYLGEITGEISTDDLLGNIFSKFCIGK